jgi:hypothetical protein
MLTGGEGGRAVVEETGDAQAGAAPAGACEFPICTAIYCEICCNLLQSTAVLTVISCNFLQFTAPGSWGAKLIIIHYYRSEEGQI